jgi:hypothetical protein
MFYIIKCKKTIFVLKTLMTYIIAYDSYFKNVIYEFRTHFIAIKKSNKIYLMLFFFISEVLL